MKADYFIKGVAISQMVIHGLFRPCGVLIKPKGQRAICSTYTLLRTTKTRKFVNNARFLQYRNWVLVGTEMRNFGGIITYYKLNLFTK